MNVLKRWRCKDMDLAAIALVIAISGGFYWLAVKPVLASRDQFEVMKSKVTGQERNASQVAARQERIRNALVTASQALQAVDPHLEPATNVNSRISRLTGLAAKNDLKIDEVHPSEPGYCSDFGTVRVALNGRGCFASWEHFLHELAQSFPDTAIESFQLSGKPDGLVTPIEFQVSLVWYVSPRGQVLAQK